MPAVLKPTRRAIRAAIAAAFSVDRWAVFSSDRFLGPCLPLHVPARAGSMMLLALMAAAPHQVGRLRIPDDEDRDGYHLKRAQRVFDLRPTPRVTIKRGRLPYALRVFEMPDLPACVAVEIILETVSSPDVLRFFQKRNDAGEMAVMPNGLTIGLHGHAYPRMTLEINTTTGDHFSTTFSSPEDCLAPHPAELTMRVSAGIGPLVEFSKLLAGDPSAEERITAARWEPEDVEALRTTPDGRVRRRPVMDPEFAQDFLNSLTRGAGARDGDDNGQ